MRRAAKTDDNQTQVVQALRSVGASVQSLAAIGKGCPDLLVGYNGQTFLLEVKDGSKPQSAIKLTPDQIQWHRMWVGGTLAVVYGPDGALKILGLMKDANSQSVD